MSKVDVRRPLGIGHLNPKGESDDSAVFDGDIGHIVYTRQGSNLQPYDLKSYT